MWENWRNGAQGKGATEFHKPAQYASPPRCHNPCPSPFFPSSQCVDRARVVCATHRRTNFLWQDCFLALAAAAHTFTRSAHLQVHMAARAATPYWNTTRTIDVSTAPFTIAVTVRPSDKDAAKLAEQLANNAHVKAALDADADKGARGRAALQAAVDEFIRHGIPRSGYLKVSVESGSREIWLDV